MRLLAFLATLVLLGAPAAAQPVAQDLALPSPRLAPGDPLSRVGHVVVIFEENRSFDNLFGHFPGANGLAQAGDRARQTAPDGTPYATLPPVRDTSRPGTPVDARFPGDLPNGPFRIDQYVAPDRPTGDLVHRFYQEQMQINGGRMDRFAAFSGAGGLTMGHYDASAAHLLRLAREYALGDNMFHSAFGGSFLNHAFLVCAQAFVWPDAPPEIVARLDVEGRPVRDGQVTPDGFVVNTSLSVQLHPPGADPTRLVPPQDLPHIGDRLNTAGVDWRWYAGGYDDALAGRPDPLFQFHHQPFAYFRNLAPGTPGQRAHLKDLTDLYTDIAAGALPPVVFYKPIGRLNLHPGYADVADGDAHLGDLVARLQAGPQYADMLILITFDENGGFWDHVPPPVRDRWGPGTRVPLVAVGPTVRRGYVDHTQYDFGSILRTIEDRFGLQPLGLLDGRNTTVRNLLQ